MLREIGRRLDVIFFFDLDDATAKERALGRAHEEGRTDDTPETIARRLSIYHEQTEPVVEYYRTTGKLVPLHAARSVDEVYREIQQAFELLDDDAA
jgi:adenylate kinase